jgi:hypothetical protein
MGTPNAARLTKEDFLTVIENYRRNGRDTTELEKAFQEAFPDSAKDETLTVEARVAELRSQSPVTEGTCYLCGAEGTLRGGVCETCFLPWATKVAEDNIARTKRNRRGEKL